MIQRIEFKNRKGLTLRGFIHQPKKYNTAIVFLHGFPGDCNSKTSLRRARTFEKLDYLSLRFDFSGTNKSDGKFEDKLMSEEVKDTRCAIDFLQKNYKYKKLILIGFSTGAIDAALYAYTDRRVDKVILVGGVGNLKEAVRYDFTDEQVRDFWTRGYIVYKNKGHWTNKKKLKKAFYDEFFKLDVLGSVHKFKKPILIVHGEKDEAVPVNKDPHELYRAASGRKKLVIMGGGDHRLSKQKHWKKTVLEIKKFIGY